MTRAFISATLERAVKTLAQTLVALWGSNAVFDITNINLVHSLAVAGSAAALSIVTSVAGNGWGHNGPSLASEAVVPSPPA